MKLTELILYLQSFSFFLPVTRKTELDEALVCITQRDTQPFSIVEDKEFMEFVAKLDPTYVLPTRKVYLVTWIKYESSIKFQKLTTVFFL